MAALTLAGLFEDVKTLREKLTAWCSPTQLAHLQQVSNRFFDFSLIKDIDTKIARTPDTLTVLQSMPTMRLLGKPGGRE